MDGTARLLDVAHARKDLPRLGEPISSNQLPPEVFAPHIGAGADTSINKGAPPPRGIFAADVSRDGRFALLVFDHGEIHVFRVSEASLERLDVLFHSQVRSAVFSPDGKTIVSTSNDQTGSLKLWKLAASGETIEFEENTNSNVGDRSPPAPINDGSPIPPWGISF